MKRIFILLIVSIGLSLNAAAQLKSEVNQCVELTAISFRLAGAEEYADNSMYKYVQDIDTYFDKHKNHPLIEYCKKVREQQLVGYGSVAFAAMFIDIKDGKVKNLSTKAHPISSVDNRWTEASFNTYVKLLNDFYKKTKFNEFYEQHADLRKLAEKRFDDIVSSNIDTTWFNSSFVGKQQDYKVIVSLGNGASNYGIKDIDGNICQIIGTGADGNGDPIYNSYTITILVHEILHGYVNQLADKYWSQMENAANKIFPCVADQMRKIAYGDARSVIGEWCVRLVTLMYVKDNPIEHYPLDLLMNFERQSGFVWMDSSVEYLDKFHKNRDKYRKIDDFMPQLVNYIDSIGGNIEQIVADYNKNIPNVSDMSPADSSVISAETDKVIFKFSTPMQPKMASMATNGVVASKAYWQDSVTFVFPIDITKKESGAKCEIILMAYGFVSEKGIEMLQNYKYSFTVKKQ